MGFQIQDPNYSAGSESFVRTKQNEDLCLKVKWRFKELNLNLNPYKWWKQGCVCLFPHNFLFPQWAALSQKGRKPKSLIKRIIPVTKRHLLLSEKPITHASDVMRGPGRCAVYLFAKYTSPSRSDEQKNEENEWTVFALRLTGRWFGVSRALDVLLCNLGV